MKPQDPLALAIFGAALALLAGLLLYVLVFKTPESATPARAFDIVGEVRRQIDGIAGRLQDKPPPVAKPQAPPPAARPVPAQPPVAKPSLSARKDDVGPSLEAGRSWRYAVVVEPPTWRDITLTYRTQREGAGIGVLTDFVYAGGKTNFHLGTFAAGHPSHGQTRFPGFFMYPSYFGPMLEKGQRMQWQWPAAREGRFKNYECQVIRWENLQVPAGTFRAAVIDCTLMYHEEHAVQARVKETIWYAPAVFQIVKVIREGKSPDEASSRIVAELVEYR